jgi:hypothetical protein
MTTRLQLIRISTGMSLIAQALGFTSLGLLSLINKPRLDLGNTPALETPFCAAGIVLSLLAGAIFTIAAYWYWNRYLSTCRRSPLKAAPNQPRPPCNPDIRAAFELVVS